MRIVQFNSTARTQNATFVDALLGDLLILPLNGCLTSINSTLRAR